AVVARTGAQRRRPVGLQPALRRAGSAAQPGARAAESARLPGCLCRLQCAGREGRADRRARRRRSDLAHRHELPRAAARRLDAVRDALWAYATAPEFVYAHRWRLGDLLVWDNRSTMHRRDPFDNAARRVMHRTQIKGKWQPRAYVAAA